MNRRIRRLSQTNKSDHGYLRYLKPGALAQLRDSKINARSRQRSFDSRIYLCPGISSSPTSSPSRSPDAAGDGQQQQEATGVGTTDGDFPCFFARTYTPRCPQRKKLMAAKSMFFRNPNPNGLTADGPEPVIDVLSTDLLVAH